MIPAQNKHKEQHRISWKEQLPQASIALCFGSISALFIGGAIPNVIAAILGWYAGKVLFQKIEKSIGHKGIRKASRIVIITLALCVAVFANEVRHSLKTDNSSKSLTENHVNSAFRGQ